MVRRSDKIKMVLLYQMTSCYGPKEPACGPFQNRESWESGVFKVSNDPAYQDWSPRTIWSTFKAKINP
jgi:hypothetical protein